MTNSYNPRNSSHRELAFPGMVTMKTGSACIAPRKRPVQARSKATVDTLIEATAQVLVARGYQGSTTDAVAERAGVSIGTLYQYFANKESLIAALIRNHVEEILATVRDALSRDVNSSLEETLRALIRAGIEAHRINPALHKVLSEQIPREAYPDEAVDVSGKLQTMIEQFLRNRTPHLPQERRYMIAFVVESTIEALTHRAVVETSDWLRYGRLEQEAMKLLCPYLIDAMQ
jgi:AcrR family transcriptional regulator